ncbi:MAG TPA: DNA/RNA non-specific endonuclease [Pyrinomonadaceae bacterium]|nr:DNA/RNA non-specific endonuclease [Pyrinomonadaceae bacterium]
MKKFYLSFLVLSLFVSSLTLGPGVRGQTDPTLRSEIAASDRLEKDGPTNLTVQPLPFSQNWSNTGLITTDDNWANVPGIIGYRGDALAANAADPQTITADGSGTPVDVNANQTDPNTFGTGGVTEFTLTDPVIAIKGSGTAVAPHIVLNLNTTGGTNIVVAYNLRDIDGSVNNAVQPVALQYRVGTSGSYTNVPAAFVADASAGPSTATLVTPVSAALPAACDNQPVVQVRIITNNAVGVDEWIGIDDIVVTAAGGSSSPSGSGSATPNNPNAGDPVLLTVTVTPGSSPTSTNLAVETDLTNIGGSATQAFFDDGTNGDTTPSDNVFSFATNVVGGTTSGIKLLSFRVFDAEARESTGNIQITVQGTSNPSGTGSASPSSVQPGGSSLLSFTVLPGTLPTSTGIVVTGNLSSIGGSSTQIFTDNGSNNFSFPVTVPGNATEGLKTFPITITDAQSRTGTGSISLTVLVNVSHTPAEHRIMGDPTAAGATDQNDWLLERNQYVVGYNCSKGIANWVAWHIDASWLGSANRTDNYRADTSLPPGCYQVQGSDYSGNVNNGGFDRGHSVPSGDRTNSVPDNDATFLMTNFIPQAPQNNQGVWNNMENYIRTQITAGNEVYTWMGSAGQGGIGLNGFANTVANGHVVVPAYVWRVVMVLPVGSNDLARVDANTRVFAVLTPNVQNANGLNTNWMTYICPVSKIEQLTGMTFFPNVPAATASVLKQKIDPILAAQTVGSGTVTNLTLAYPLTYMTGNVVVNGTLALGPHTLMTNNTTGSLNYKITLGPNATVTRLNSGMVNGTVEKQFTSATSFTFPVGSHDGYSPVTANLTALGGPSSLTVTPRNITHPNSFDPSFTLKRYWTLTESGDLTANLIFKYLDTDVPAGVNESSLALHKFDSVFTLINGVSVDTNANTVTTTTPVNSFSDWTLIRPMNPANDLTVSGRVTIPRAGTSGVRAATVTFTDQQTGAIRTTVTDALGNYNFGSITSGTTFTATVTARGLLFPSRTIQVFSNLVNEDFSGQRR